MSYYVLCTLCVVVHVQCMCTVCIVTIGKYIHVHCTCTKYLATLCTYVHCVWSSCMCTIIMYCYYWQVHVHVQSASSYIVYLCKTMYIVCGSSCICIVCIVTIGKYIHCTCTCNGHRSRD